MKWTKRRWLSDGGHFKHVQIVSNENTNTTVRGTDLSATEPHANVEPSRVHAKIALREPVVAGQNTNRERGANAMRSREEYANRIHTHAWRVVRGFARECGEALTK